MSCVPEMLVLTQLLFSCGGKQDSSLRNKELGNLVGDTNHELVFHIIHEFLVFSCK